MTKPFNNALARTILQKCEGLSLDNQKTRTDGRFLADKSYAFDTMFFVARYIQYFRFGDIFDHDHRERENEYIADLFNLERGKAQIPNYFTEALALLRFVGAIKPDGKKYRIIDDEILEILASSFENAYIFLYLLTYSVLRRHNLWHAYEDFCHAADAPSRQQAYDRFRAAYAEADKRVKDMTKQWAMFTPKYPMVVLNYANRQYMVARTGQVQEEIVNTHDISLNTKGTRNNADLPKKNGYLDELSLSYITETLRPYLVAQPQETPMDYADSLSADIADTKLQMIAGRFNVQVRRRLPAEKYRYTRGGKVRTVHGEFRSGLLKKTPHVCPVCGFSFEEFLTAAHIKPYAMCDDTYDAMNPHNGLLLCPVCDRLFESGNHMTIDFRTGDVLLAEDVAAHKDFAHLQGRTVHPDYINCERRHYMQWHNDFFRQKHGK